jgi:hypothetical protein
LGNPHRCLSRKYAIRFQRKGAKTRRRKADEAGPIRLTKKVTVADLPENILPLRLCAFALKFPPNQAKTVSCLFFATRLILTP